MTIEDLSKRLNAFRTKNPNRRLPSELRTEVTEVFRSTSMAASSFARKIGVSPATLKKWLASLPSSSNGSFRKINIDVSSSQSSEWIVHGPRGIRIQGLQIADLADLIDHLGAR